MPRLYCNATLLRKRIKALPRQEALRLLGLLYPEQPSGMLALLVDHPDETRVNGAALDLPASWEKLK